MKQLQQRRQTDNRGKTSRRHKEERNPEGMKNGYKQKKWKREKISSTLQRRGGGLSLLFTHFIILSSLFPSTLSITPFLLSSPPCFLFQTFGIHTLEET
jgi:hypothetical protein